MRNRYIVGLFFTVLSFGLGANINDLNDNGLTPLMIESREGRLRNVKALVENNPDIDLNVRAGKNAKGKKGKLRRRKSCSKWTALMFAIDGGHKDVAKYLISRGASPFVGDDRGHTAYTMADKIPGLTEFINSHSSQS